VLLDAVVPCAVFHIMLLEMKPTLFAPGSANDNVIKLQAILSKRVDPSTFTDVFFASDAFQHSNQNKVIDAAIYNEQYYLVNQRTAHLAHIFRSVNTFY
jgi:hypothetical protein